MTEGGAVRSRRRAGALERTLWFLGLSVLALCAGALVHRAVGSREDLRRFERARSEIAPSPARAEPPTRVLEEPPATDFSLWAAGRVDGYRKSLRTGPRIPLAVLQIPRLGLRVAVLEGTDEMTLNRGLGHIEGTALPGRPGNVGLAGHRDGFFRCLKDVRLGDRVLLELPRSEEEYAVTGTRIVAPTDTSVLAPTATPMLTLVTCYPFYYVGSAPQRFIVQAMLVPAGSTGSAPGPLRPQPGKEGG